MFGRLHISKNAFIVLAITCALFLATTPAVHAASQPLVVVEVFKDDTVHLDLGSTTHVTRTLTIQNMVNQSIVPGEITLTLQKQSPSMIGPIAIPFTSNIRPVNVTNVSAQLSDGTVLKDIQVSQVNNSTVIKYGAWVPISPYQNLTVILNYDSPDIVDRGLLFNTVQYPFTSSSIPVEKAVIEADANGQHITYASEKPVVNGDLYTWDKSQLGMGSWGISLEYSILPLPMLPISGSMLFWGIIILVCLIWVVWTYMRPRKSP